MHFIVIDLEATVKRNRDEPVYLTEIGAIKINSSGNLVSKFHSYIKPTNNRYIKDVKIDNKITTRKADLKNAQEVKIVMGKFQKWISKGDYVLVFWSYSDLYLLMNQFLNRRFDLSWLKNYCDLQENFTAFINEKNPISLKRAIDYVDLGFVGEQHNALNDAYNTARILNFLFNKSAYIKFDQNPFDKLICHLYKICKKCNETKYYLKFSKNNNDQYKNICLECASEKNKLKNERRALRRIESVNLSE